MYSIQLSFGYLTVRLSNALNLIRPISAKHLAQVPKTSLSCASGMTPTAIITNTHDITVSHQESSSYMVSQSIPSTNPNCFVERRHNPIA